MSDTFWSRDRWREALIATARVISAVPGRCPVAEIARLNALPMSFVQEVVKPWATDPNVALWGWSNHTGWEVYTAPGFTSKPHCYRITHPGEHPPVGKPVPARSMPASTTPDSDTCSTAQQPNDLIIETKEHHTMKISIKRVTLINGNDITKFGHDKLIEAMSTLTTTISELRKVKATMPSHVTSASPSFKAIDNELAEANEAFTAVVEELDRRGG